MEINKSGGLLVGATDKNGEQGIQVVSPSGDKLIRMGGGEMIVVSDASKSTEKHEFDGKEMTPCEVVSEINYKNGGVRMPCQIAEQANTTESQMEIGEVIKSGGITSYKLGGLFHGSDRKFTKFSLDNVGAGGASTGGWGIYASTGRDVANQYRLKSGALYEVTIYENGDWLDLDEPIDGDQGDRIVRGLKKKKISNDSIEEFKKDLLAQGEDGYEVANGKQVYDYLSATFGSEKNASKFLSTIGIIGNRFKDKTLPDETNYVIFNADDIKIDGEADESEEEYKTGGNIPKSAIKEGTKVELEHRDTIEKIKNNPNISVEKSAELIARDHLNESKDYYKKLKEMEANLSHGGKLSDEQAEMIWLLKTEGPRSFNDSINESIANDLVSKGLVHKSGNEYGLTKKGEIEMMAGGGKVKEKSTSLLAPNGKPSNLNTKQYEIVRSKEFKKWFGDWENNPSGASKITDENGEPRIVYHGTGTTITEFKPEYLGQGNDQLGSGFYFTNSIDEAEAYTTNTINRQPKLGGSENPNVISAFLDIKKPLHETTPDKSTASQIQKILEASPDFENNLWNFGDWQSEGKQKTTRQAVDAYKGSYDTLLRLINAIGNDFYRGHEKELLEQVNKIYGYDGLKHTFENGKTHFVAWFPTQIKLADGSNTTFNKNKPDIRLHTGGNIPNKTNDTQTCKCKTMEYHEKLTACQKTKLGDKYLGEGTTVKDTKTGLASDIKSIEHRGFKLLPQSSFDNAPRQEFFVPFEEFVDKFEAGLIDVSGYEHNEADHKLMHVVIKDIIACNIIKELESGYLEEVFEESMSKGGYIGSVKANKKGEIKEIRDVNGKLLKQIHVGDVTYVRNVEDGNYRNTKNDLLMRFESAGIHMAYGGIVGVEEMPNYFRVDISSPRKVSTCRTPKWASHAAESVKKGAKVVTCKKYKDWFISSVLVPKDGITEGGAKEIASEIKDKIEHKKMEKGGVIYETGSTSDKVNNLILFADSTKNLAEMRDAVYMTIESRIKNGGKPTIEDIANRFNTFLVKSAAQYVREMGNTKEAMREVGLSEKEQKEFKMLYALEFPNWLKEKYGKDISHQVAEYVSSLYGTSFYSGGQVGSLGADLDVDYDKVRAIKYWGDLKPKERLHFLIDHADEYFNKPLSELIGTKEFDDYKKLASSDWNSLPSGVHGSIENHVIMGTYCAGGIMENGGETEVNGYTSTNPEIEQYLKDDVDATTKGLLVLIECSTEESEKENLRKRLSESN